MSNTITIIGRQVGRIGYGAMGNTLTPKPDWEKGITALKAAYDNGSTLFNSATFYGIDDPLNNLYLLNKFYEKYPECIDKTVLIVKGGLTSKDGKLSHTPVDVDAVREEVQAAQKALGKKKIDVFELGRLPVDKSIEDTMGILKTLKDEGHFSAIGLSEAKAETITRALKVIDVAHLEIEVSLWSLDEDIQAAIKTCTEHHIPIVAYSPLGRGMLTGKWKSPEDLPKDSRYRSWPRFQGENFKKNFELVEKVEKLAEKKGVTKSQFALAYILQLSPEMLPIPGSTNPERIVENIKAEDVKLSAEEKEELEVILKSFKPAGSRYPQEHQANLML